MTKWENYQSIISVGIGLNFLFGLFDTALSPALAAVAKRRTDVLKQIRGGSNVDAVAVDSADNAVQRCESAAKFLSRWGIFPSIFFGVLGISLLIYSSEYSEEYISINCKLTALSISLSWPLISTFVLLGLFIIIEFAMFNIKSKGH